ncbi:MAG: hypothetical protein J0M18_02440 [Ignavibacteria bacterium]|nr:hypothetical protein [Ignavibacteria bacterium]
MKIKQEIEEMRYFLKEHLIYEINMFNLSLIKLVSLYSQKNKTPEEEFYINLLLESYANHGRSLITFFCNKKIKYADDALAVHFFENADDWFRICGEKNEVLKNFIEYVGKHTMHLTYSRNKIAESKKGQDFSAHNPITELIIKFKENLPEKYKGIL